MLSIGETWMTGSIFAAVVIGIRLIGGHRLPKVLMYWLWNVSAVLFLVPFRFTTPVSVYALPVRTGTPAVAHGPEWNIGAVISTLSETAARTCSMERGVAALLLAGTVLGLGFCSFQLVLWSVRLGKAEQVEEIDCSCLPSTGRTVMIFRSEAVSSPCVRGTICVRIYFPASWRFDQGWATRTAILHEWAHVVHWDNIRKGIFLVLLCLQWYNPIVWGMVFLANRDMELFSDEYVLRHGEGDIRAPYARMLLGCRSGVGMPSSSYFAAGAVRERIVAIMGRKESSGKKHVLALLCFVTLLLLFATGAKAVKVMPQDVGVSEVLSPGEVEARYNEPFIPREPTIYEYQGEQVKVGNGDILTFGDGVGDQDVEVTFSMTPVEGYWKGQQVGYGYIKEGECFELGYIRLSDGMTVEFPLEGTGAEGLYLLNYCADSIYVDKISTLG